MAPEPHSSEEHRGTTTWDFENLVNIYYQPLYQFAMSLTRSEAEASDLTQQTFYIWARKGHQLRDPSKVKTWLYTTLHREFLKSCRRRARYPECDLSDADPDLPTTAPATGEHLDAATVLEALGQIEEAYRAPLVLFYLEDLPYREISVILNIPMGTVQSRIARGKARLQQYLLRKDRRG